MGIEIKVPRAVKIRRLKAKHDYLSEADIAKLTGYAPAIVREALQSGTKGKAVQK
jgi:hypothetical protein